MINKKEYNEMLKEIYIKASRLKNRDMEIGKTIDVLYRKIDILEESKMMNNRLYVSRANRLIRKLQKHKHLKI